MPTPGKDETQQKFVSRCIPIVLDDGTAKDQKQAAAICYSMWREHKKKSLLDRVAEAVKSWFEKDVAPEAKDNSFFVWKEAGGDYRWLAVYSSKFRDDDRPPEILSEAAHKEFVAACDTGAWPMPELWLWHVKGTVSGRADWLAYDDAGFALASGVFAPEAVAVAERLAVQDDLLTSHGMPAKEIERDAADPTVITRYRTREISPLPAWAAANKHTGFYLLKEVDDMALPEEKRRWLADMLGEEKAAAVEAGLEAKGKSLADEGVEYKAAEPPVETPAAEPPAPEPEAAPEPPADSAPKEAAPEAPAIEYATRAEVADAVALTVTPMLERIEALAADQAKIAAALDGLGKELKELAVSDAERLKTMAMVTPGASLFAQIQSAIGSKEAEIDGRSSLAKAGPKGEPDAEHAGPSFVPLINEFIAASRAPRGQ